MLLHNKFFYHLTLITTLLLFALWNFPGTISLRYLCLLILLGVATTVIREATLFIKWAWPVWLFLLYIIFHGVFVAPEAIKFFDVYWKDWIKFVLIVWIAAGVGVVFFTHYSSRLFLYLGVATAIPSIVHTAMFAHQSIVGGGIPWGYAGLNVVHGYFAMSSIQSAVLLMGHLFFLRKNRWESFAVVTVIVVCILSNLVALSRGGLLFLFLTLIFSLMVYFFFTAKNRALFLKLAIITGGVVAVFSAMYLFLAQAQLGKVWDISQNWDKVKIALMGDPVKINCEGLGVLRQEMAEKNIILTPSQEQALAGVDGGDAARIVTLRAGLALLMKNPWGTDGSRQGYNRAIEKICQPVINMSHTHNAWMDTALSIGIAGALIMAFIFMRYALLGWNALRRVNDPTQVLGYCLFVLSVMWFFRGFLDATLITHTLEMQAFSLALLASMICLFRLNDAPTTHE